jgi:hypothetical protein
VERIPEVETARQLMTEAMRWSVMKWLREKKRVRITADQANAALDQLSAALRKNWPAELRTAYDALAPETESSNSGKGVSGKKSSPQNGAAQLAVARKIKEADDEAYRARMDAEKTFDEAEKKLSTARAREGCLKAVRAWELQEKAVRQAREATGR